jgi:hypothetical protein
MISPRVQVHKGDALFRYLRDLAYGDNIDLCGELLSDVITKSLNTEIKILAWQNKVLSAASAILVDIVLSLIYRYDVNCTESVFNDLNEAHEFCKKHILLLKEHLSEEAYDKLISSRKKIFLSSNREYDPDRNLIKWAIEISLSIQKCLEIV